MSKLVFAAAMLLVGLALHGALRRRAEGLPPGIRSFAPRIVLGLAIGVPALILLLLRLPHHPGRPRRREGALRAGRPVASPRGSQRGLEPALRHRRDGRAGGEARREVRRGLEGSPGRPRGDGPELPPASGPRPRGLQVDRPRVLLGHHRSGGPGGPQGQHGHAQRGRDPPAPAGDQGGYPEGPHRLAGQVRDRAEGSVAGEHPIRPELREGHRGQADRGAEGRAEALRAHPGAAPGRDHRGRRQGPGRRGARRGQGGGRGDPDQGGRRGGLQRAGSPRP